MLRTCLSNDIIVHDFSFNYFCKHCIHCICYCSKFCTLTLNLYIFERRNKINQTNKQTLRSGNAEELVDLTDLNMAMSRLRSRTLLIIM